jgi:RND superfamily putative drug exporter
LGLLALIVVPVPLVRGISVAGVFIPLVASLVALTLVPLLLDRIGPRIDSPRRAGKGAPSRGWSAWAVLVVRHRVPATLAGVAVLGVLTAAAVGVNIGVPRAGSLAGSGPAHQGLAAVQQAGFSDGVLTSMPVWLPSGADPAATAARLTRVPGVRGALVPAGREWRQDGSGGGDGAA